MGLSKYCSELFKNQIYPAFQLEKLKTSVAANTYQLSVNMACDYCRKDFLDITAVEAQDFFDFLSSGGGSQNGRPLSKKTIFMRYSCIRSLSSYIQLNQVKFGIEYMSPFLYIDLQNPSKELSSEDILTLKEMDAILNAAKDTQMYLLVSLVLTCGLTVQELIELRPRQLVLDEKNRLSISFLKANKTDYRYVKVPESIKEALLQHAYEAELSGFTVFRNKQGRPYSRRVLEMHVKELMEEAGLKGWTLRDLRNTASVYMLTGGANPQQMATQLGICERWIYRYKKVVEEIDVQAGDYSCLTIRAPKKHDNG